MDGAPSDYRRVHTQNRTPEEKGAYLTALERDAKTDVQRMHGTSRVDLRDLNGKECRHCMASVARAIKARWQQDLNDRYDT